jgi:hypothetical protein
MTQSDAHANLRELIVIADDACQKIFRKRKEVLPMYHAIRADGSNFVFPAPPGSKDISVALTRALFENERVIAYVFVDEAWTLHSAIDAPKLKRVMKHGIAEHPDRIEIIMFAAEDASGMMMAYRKIIRPAHGEAKLGDRIEFYEDVVMEGRMVGLLPRREGKMQ